MALCDMEERQLKDDEWSDCRLWLAVLKEVDPLRVAKWDDIERSLKPSSLD